MKITKKEIPFSPKPLTLFTITNESGASVTLSSLGAGIVAIRVPDRDGRIEDVVLGYDNPESYMADGPCMGKIPGRYANRIAKGHLEIDGKTCQLAINNGPNALHGGPTGFQNRIWDAEETASGVKFTYRSEDGEENYPGNLTVTAEYAWSDDNALTLEITAETDAPTVVNLTNHAYFNLDGADAGSILNHKLKLKSNRFLPTDETQIPTGELQDVAGTPMDFRELKEIGRDISADFIPLKIGKGYDHCWVIDGWEKGLMIDEAVVLEAEKSGRRLVIDSTQPGVQVYTGNWLDGCPTGKNGKEYKDYEGVAIEMQGFPDAPNKPGFPSQILLPGEEYRQTIIFKFGY